MNKKPVILDKWDCKVISLFKNHFNAADPLTLDKFKQVWAERCVLEIKYVKICYITEHFMLLARDLGLFDNDYIFYEFINDLDSKNNWKFVCSGREYIKSDTADFQTILLSRLDSLFALTEVDRLPGYKEYINLIETI